jgi:hypothetical protein
MAVSPVYDARHIVRPSGNYTGRVQGLTGRGKRDAAIPVSCCLVARRSACLQRKRGISERPHQHRQASPDHDGRGRRPAALPLACLNRSHGVFDPGRLLHAVPHGGDALFPGMGQRRHAARDFLHHERAQHPWLGPSWPWHAGLPRLRPPHAVKRHHALSARPGERHVADQGRRERARSTRRHGPEPAAETAGTGLATISIFPVLAPLPSRDPSPVGERRSTAAMGQGRAIEFGALASYQT